MNISKPVTNPLRKLFSPSALAATVATGLLVHAAFAGGGGQNCLSQCPVYTDPLQCYPNNPCQLYGFNAYWCCPLGDACGQPFYNPNCSPYGYAGWCVCPN